MSFSVLFIVLFCLHDCKRGNWVSEIQDFPIALDFKVNTLTVVTSSQLIMIRNVTLLLHFKGKNVPSEQMTKLNKPIGININ